MDSASRRRWATGVAAAVAAIAAGTIVIVETRGEGRAHGTAVRTPKASASLATPSPPASSLLPLTGRLQANPYYAEPAAAAISLSTFGITVDQSAVAKKMKMNRRGYASKSIDGVVNGYLHDTPYQVNTAGGPDSEPDFVMREVAYDVGVLRRAPMVAVWGERLPWRKDTTRGRRVDHMVVAFGYDRSKGTVAVFDPWPEKGGPHTLSVAALAKALQTGGLCFIYKRSWSWNTRTATPGVSPSVSSSSSPA
ncbi:C39 family peptidase [Actinoallomurus sp. CA-150999]|uniref:C39 family peptidase n=1 Tax=Actinoallomurus sp. CA-150999 TaxID=3239887 RepID=UPI003D8B70C3